MAQTLLAFDAHPADPHIGFELGWDHAQHGVLPPPEQLHPNNPLFQGWRAGAACYAERTLGASRLAREWLQLRLHAWQRGLAFELSQVTPHYLGQLDVPLCPVTRQPIGAADASIDRVCDQAGYAAGNMVMMSRAANRAKGGCRWDEALVHAEQAKAAADQAREAVAHTRDGLQAARERRARLDETLDLIRARFGDDAIQRASLLDEPKALWVARTGSALEDDA